MDCDYCGLATGAVACWQVSSDWPGLGETRYPCAAHLEAAIGHVSQYGTPQVTPTNTEYWRRLAAAVVLSLVEPIGEAA